MIFSCSLNSLSEVVNNVSLAISAKANAIPALEGLLLECEDNQLKITGYDLDIGILGSLEVESRQNGAAILNSQLLKEMLKKMAGPTVNISTDEKFMTTISDSETEYKIIGLDPNEYPKIPQVGANQSLTIKDNVLKNMIYKTLFAVSQTSVQNPILCGSMFKIKDEFLNIVSVDGYRVALSRQKIDTDLQDISFVVPSKTLNEICKLLKDDDNAQTTIELSQNHAVFKIGGYFIVTKAAIPQKSSTTILVNPKDMAQRIERVSIMVTNRISVVMKIEDSRAFLRCESSLGKVNDTFLVEMTGNSIEKIAFNNKYMLDALKHCECEQIKINMDGPVMPIKIEPTDSDEFLYLVLPVRLKS